MIIKLSQLVERRPSNSVSKVRHDIRYAGQQVGAPKAITAMAHKLARILWHLLKHKQAFNPEVFRREEEKMKRQKLARLQNLAAALNYQLVPQP